MINSVFNGDKITSSSNDAFTLFEKSRLGEKSNGKIEYSSVEALFLVETERMQVFFGKKMIDFDNLLKKLRNKDKRIEVKYNVFKNLRKKGLIVKTALKFGADFRIYDKGIKPGEEHARWILYAIKETEALKWHEFTAKNRIAHSTNKKLLLGIVDEEGDVSYYECNWIRV